MVRRWILARACRRQTIVEDDDDPSRWRRKEVSLGKHGTLAILATLAAGASAVFADAPATLNPSAKTESTWAAELKSVKAPEPSNRREPPAPPRQYLEAGARLFNERRYELATKYLGAANMYRDRLNVSERIVLDVYLDNLDEYRRQLQMATAPAAVSVFPLAEKNHTDPGKSGIDVGVVPANTTNAGWEVVRDVSQSSFVATDASSTAKIPSAAGTATANPVGAPRPRFGLDQGPVYGTTSWRDSASKKEKARWLMQLAREQIHKGHFEIAEQAIAEARTMDVKWTVFDETPTKMTEALHKARASKAKEKAPPSVGPRDRRAAKARLREARAALAANDLDRAQEIAREVKSWGLVSMFFDDTPDKVTAAVFAGRNRPASRNFELELKPFASGLLESNQAAPFRLPPSGAASTTPSGVPDRQ
jgi:hypothetical protein